jgi:hypothetical protein
MAELGMRTGLIVTRDEEDRVELNGRAIEVMPAWRFLLSLPQD